jgi:hypothetical protein
MSKSKREVVLDVDELPETTSLPNEEDDESPTQLPKPLAEFKQYVDSKFCYNSKPVEHAEIISVEPKVAY